MNCDECAAVEANPRSGLFRAGCIGCQTRMLAHAPAFQEASKAGSMTPIYRQALRSVFGDEWKAGHRKVREWGRRLAGDDGT